jgi:hypothetical protein
MFSMTESDRRLLVLDPPPRPWHIGDHIRVRARCFQPSGIWTVTAIDEDEDEGDTMDIVVRTNNIIVHDQTIGTGEAMLVQDDEMDICQWVLD